MINKNTSKHAKKILKMAREKIRHRRQFPTLKNYRGEKTEKKRKSRINLF